MAKMIKYFLLITGILLLLVSLLSLLVINFNLGTVILVGASCGLISYGFFYEWLVRLKWLTYGILTMGASALLIMLFIGIYGKNDNVTFNEDAVIVLGAGIRGERVSRLLSYRLDKAVEYRANNPKALIVVSGGQGPQESITEAAAMSKYLINKGVPEEVIVKEDAATSTYENLLYSKDILAKLFDNPYETVVITNSFHIYRATRLAEKLGYNVTHYSAKIEWYSAPLNYSRECLAVLKMWLLGK